jgi:hypothetical protein
MPPKKANQTAADNAKAATSDTRPEPAKTQRNGAAVSDNNSQSGQPGQHVAQGKEGGQQTDQKQWADAYSSIFSSPTRGFEMGENRRFKQRIFKFTEKPEQSIIDMLKKNGFVYRPSEKAWTIAANPATRQLSEQLAKQFHGEVQQNER